MTKFIDVTNVFNDEKTLIAVDKIILVEKSVCNGGCSFIVLNNRKLWTRGYWVKESIEEIKQKIADLSANKEQI